MPPTLPACSALTPSIRLPASGPGGFAMGFWTIVRGPFHRGPALLGQPSGPKLGAVSHTLRLAAEGPARQVPGARAVASGEFPEGSPRSRRGAWHARWL